MCQGLEMHLHLEPRPSSSWRLGNTTVAYARSIYPLIKISSILKKRRKTYLELVSLLLPFPSAPGGTVVCSEYIIVKTYIKNDNVS